MSVRVFAPAKINLTLEVGAPRADGYHPLQSLVMFADVGDWVEARPAEDVSLDVSGPFAANLEGENLIVRAARVLAAHAGVTSAAALTLEKNLPVAAGIGGGSSDAAAALKALNRLWALNLEPSELRALSRELGADVPVCIDARAAWMSGIGDNLAAIETPSVAAVLVNAVQPLSTGAVFRRFDEMALGRGFAERPPPTMASATEMVAFARARGNDLAKPARALMPELDAMEHALKSDARVIYAGLSGSGATMFALVGSNADAKSLASDLVATRPHWWVRATTLA
jgi:4-diphosphocytidyl-2-C-methyl-D-erythritol kinase